MATIQELYTTLLGRDADADGLAYWQNQLNSGTPLDEIANAFRASSEYQVDANDIESMYRDNFGRDADTSGAQYWLSDAARQGLGAWQLNDAIKQSASGYDATALADSAKYPTAWDAGYNPDADQLRYNPVADRWERAATPPPTPGNAPDYREAASFVSPGAAQSAAYTDPGAYQRLADGDYEALQKALYDGATAGLGLQEQRWRDQADQSASNRGIWSSGMAERLQGDVTERLAPVYQQAGANAVAQRYGLQQADNQGANQYQLARADGSNQFQLANAGRLDNYNLSSAGMQNQYNLDTTNAYNNWSSNMYGLQNQYDLGLKNYDLGLRSNANQLQQINDSYALNRAQMLNDANAQASNAQWQAQWTPANFLSGVWNGTGGTISSGSSGGGWNFMI